MKNKSFFKSFGLFETMRSLNGKIVYFDAHLERLVKSCCFLKLRLPAKPDKLKAEIRRAVSLSGFPDNYVKLTVKPYGPGSKYSLLVKAYQPYPGEKYASGFCSGVAFQRQDAGSFLAQIKTSDRGFYESSFQEAKARGFDEAVILNSYGYVAEGTRSNIFMARNKELFTPELDCPCLDGITRRVILDLAKKAGVNIFEAKFTLKDLYDSDEAFLTNSLMGVMPLTSIEKKNIGCGKAGKLTKWLIGKYNSLLK